MAKIAYVIRRNRSRGETSYNIRDKNDDMALLHTVDTFEEAEAWVYAELDREKARLAEAEPKPKKKPRSKKGKGKKK